MTALAADRAELVGILFGLQQALEELVVRGLASTGPDELRQLRAHGDELARAGAGYLAGQVGALVHAMREGGDAARALLHAQTAMRVFERALSLDEASEALATLAEAAPVPATAAAGPGGGGRSGAAPPVPVQLPAPAALPAPVQQPPTLPTTPSAAPPPPVPVQLPAPAATLVPLLDEVAAVVEGLVAAGLTAATAATQQKLDASFREVSRLKLLRLAAVLRYVHDELGRFVADSAEFSARRLAFFVHRGWLLARALARAIIARDEAALGRLLRPAPAEPAGALVVAVLGVQKRGLLDGSAVFEFRMQVLEGDLAPGTRLVWSCVFGARKGVAPEAFLHLPQPQKFAPKILLEPTAFRLTQTAVTLDATGGRLALGPRATVTPGAALAAPARPVWQPAAALARVRAQAISPLDLEIELQEDIVVTDYTLGALTDHPFRSELQVIPLHTAGLTLDAIVPRGPDGAALAAALAGLAEERPPLYGLLHYEMARLVFQPLTALAADGPRHLMIAHTQIDLAALMKTMDFST